MATLMPLPPSVVIAAAELTDEMSSKTGMYMATQPIMLTTETITASSPTDDAIDTSNAMHINTATATSSMNDIDSQPLPLIYNHKKVWLLLENAKLEGWQEGFEEGHRTGRKTGQEEGKKRWL